MTIYDVAAVRVIAAVIKTAAERCAHRRTGWESDDPEVTQADVEEAAEHLEKHLNKLLDE